MQSSWITALSSEPTTKMIRIDGPQSSAAVYALSCLANLDTVAKPILVLTPDDERAEEIVDDLCCFLPQSSVFRFPKRRLHHRGSILIGESYASERIVALDALVNQKHCVVVASYGAICQPTMPAELLTELTLTIKKEQDIELNALTTKLGAAGFERTSLVHEVGQFAIRGGIVDVFSPAHHCPHRIEFFGSTIESIRQFDPTTQRSTAPSDEFTILPCSEVVFDNERARAAIDRIKTFADARDYPKRVRDRFEELLRSGVHDVALEDLLPLIYGSFDSVFSYLPSDATLALFNQFGIDNKQEEFRTQLEAANDEADSFFDGELFLSAEELQRQLAKRHQILFEDIGEQLGSGAKEVHLDTQTVANHTGKIISELRQALANGFEVRVVCYNDMQKKRLESIFLEELSQPDSKLRLSVGLLQHGFSIPADHLIYVPDRELFGLRTKRRRSKPSSSIATDRLLSSFSDGMLVVHIDHGIGRYLGMKHLQVGGVESDFVELEYQQGDRLYLPIYRLNIIQPYSSVGSGEEIEIELDKLGSGVWEKRKGEAKRAIEAMAKELLKLYATRKVVKGYAFGGRNSEFSEFEAAFPFSETRDQLRAIDQVLGDMETARPMDRLVCGDVGFGKTEVALRAAFRAVLDHKQVAVLVPTTLLAEQHQRTFTERFKDFGVEIAGLSRFTPKKRQSEIIEQLKSHRIDVVVGTHRLLSQDIEFADLGLLVIDEEHRFGVKHKERIKSFRAKVDVVTMTATPIPRTLQMSLYGFRDLSVIETPPADRQPIHTYVARFDDQLIRNAVLKEIKRGGQVFFVHNRVHTIDSMANYLKGIVPEARIGIVHGQQSEGEVEKSMLNFLHREIDILLATTIIESGLDFPNANTILINRSDQFGLAQLYQLRGRVGRSTREAYAHLLIPGDDLISGKAQKRLRALRSFTNLGSGYKIALRDLEIRGAGNLLGTKQSGHIKSIGMELYADLLDKAVHELNGEEISDDFEPELTLPGSAFLPSDYIGDEHLRLGIYQEISHLGDDDAIRDYEQSLVDRFGTLPEEAKRLVDIVSLRAIAKRLGVIKVAASHEKAVIQFSDSPNLKPEKLLALLADPKASAKMLNPTTLSVSTSEYYSTFSAEAIKNLLRTLT